MESHILTLYNSSHTPYDLDGPLSFRQEDLERESEEPMSMEPLAMLPPISNGSSRGDSLKSTARSGLC
jgi:hypothetical protein